MVIDSRQPFLTGIDWSLDFQPPANQNNRRNVNRRRVEVRPDRRLLMALSAKSMKPLPRGHSCRSQVVVTKIGRDFERWVFIEELPHYRDLFVERHMLAWQQLGYVVEHRIRGRRCWRLLCPVPAKTESIPVAILWLDR